MTSRKINHNKQIEVDKPYMKKKNRNNLLLPKDCEQNGMTFPNALGSVKGDSELFTNKIPEYMTKLTFKFRYKVNSST